MGGRSYGDLPSEEGEEEYISREKLNEWTLQDLRNYTKSYEDSRGIIRRGLESIGAIRPPLRVRAAHIQIRRILDENLEKLVVGGKNY